MHDPTFKIEKSSLYIVATPIGNLDDITIRALSVLKQVDIIAAEDTRVTGQLLKYFNIQTPLLSLRAHNERSMTQKLIARLTAGESIAQVSDAGTPSISDPGALLVEAVRTAGFLVSPVPGCSALTAALSASGFTTQQMLFYGFLPSQTKARCKILHELKYNTWTTVFYEAPHRIAECLADLVNIFGGERQAVLARELTKTFETIRKMPLTELAQWVHNDHYQQRGEAVLIIEAATPHPATASNQKLDALLEPLLAELPLKQAVHLAKAISALPRDTLYKRALELKANVPIIL